MLVHFSVVLIEVESHIVTQDLPKDVHMLLIDILNVSGKKDGPKS